MRILKIIIFCIILISVSGCIRPNQNTVNVGNHLYEIKDFNGRTYHTNKFMHGDSLLEFENLDDGYHYTISTYKIIIKRIK